jgi:hypothetical protein
MRSSLVATSNQRWPYKANVAPSRMLSSSPVWSGASRGPQLSVAHARTW